MARRPELAAQDDGVLLHGTPEQREMLLEKMRREGLEALRINTIYSKTKGGRDFSELDGLVDAAIRRGIRPQLTIMADPIYNEGDAANSPLSAARPNSKVMGQFARAVAQHFNGRVNRYSIGNEPNHTAFLRAKDPAKAYRRQFDQGYAAVKGVNRGAEVLLGELMPSNAISFLERVVQAGGKRPLRASGFALHPYDVGPIRRQPRDNPHGGLSNLGNVQRALARLAEGGRFRTGAGKQVPLYLTEYGLHESTGSAPVRAARLADAYAHARKHKARQLLQYQLTDKPDSVAWDTSLDPELIARAIRGR